MEQKFSNFSKLVLFGAVALGTMTGCNKKPEPQTERIAVNLRADINPSLIKSASTLKVANDQWSAGDEVGLFMKRAGQALTASGAIYSEADNARMSVASGSLVATPPITYPEAGNVDFIAYYPFTASLGAGFALPINVASNQTAGLPVEVLYSNNRTNQAATASAVTLNFEYSLAKLEVNVTGGANSTLTAADFAAMTVSIEGMYRQATLQLANGTISNTQAKQTLSMRRTSTTAAAFEALAVPLNEEITFLFNVAGATYRRTIPQPNYEAGNLYKLNFALDFPEPKVATLLNAVIIKRKENTQNISVVCNDLPTSTFDGKITATVDNGNAYNSIISSVSAIGFINDNERPGGFAFEKMASANYLNGGFTLILPSSPETTFLTGNIETGMGEGYISDKNAKVVTVHSIRAYNDNDEQVGTFRYEKTDETSTIYVIFMYTDRDVTIITSEVSEDFNFNYNLSLKKGWNMVYATAYSQTNAEASTKAVSGLKWIFRTGN